ncbi:MAG: caspase family protein [Chitinophagaceae bacterium]
MSKNTIEIQILSPATRQQLIDLKEEIRKIDGLAAFDLKIPPAPLQQGTMDGLGEIIFHAVIAGITHFTAEKTLEHYHEKIGHILEKILGSKKSESGDATMSGPPRLADQGWQASVSNDQDGTTTIQYYGSQSNASFTNREYSIDPEHTYAILIGVSKFDDELSFLPIPPVEGNMDDMYNILVDKGLVGLPFENITRLHNETSIKIKAELQKVSRTRDIKTLLVYYTGHGQNDGKKNLSLIATDTHNIDEELHNDIPYSYVERILASSPAQQKIIFIDACHSGLATQDRNTDTFNFEPVLGSFTLASTSAEEASYFNKDARNTNFSSYLIEAFRKGTAITKKMLSLQDIFEHALKRSEDNRQPQPVCKSQLINVGVDTYYISGNPAFSLPARLARPAELFNKGQYNKAREDYLFLMEEYPSNEQLRREFAAFEREMLFNEKVKEGDQYLYGSRNYTLAREKYIEALKLKSDEGIKRKVMDCNLVLDALPNLASAPKEVVQLKPVKTPELQPVVQDSEEDDRMGRPITDEDHKKKAPKKLGPLLYAGAAILVLVVLYFIVSRKTATIPKQPITDTIASMTPEIKATTVKDPIPDTLKPPVIPQKADTSRAVFDQGRDVFGIESPATDSKDGLKKVMHLYGLKDKYGVVFSYFGETKNGKPDGKGKALNIYGTYEGEWKDGNMDGKCISRDKDGSVLTGTYVKGDLIFGTLAATAGYKYTGEFKKGEFDGQGNIIERDGSVYDGGFKIGEYSGFGTLTMASGFVEYCPQCVKYVGNWKEDVKNGMGKCYNAQGKLIYEGVFVDNKPKPPYPNR